MVQKSQALGFHGTGDLGQHVTDLGVDDDIGDGVERCGLAVDDDEFGPSTLGPRDDARYRVDREARPDCQQQVTRIGGDLSLKQVSGDQGLTKGDRGRLQDATAFGARRIGLAGAHSFEDGVHRRAVIAVETSGFAGRAMDLDHQVGVDAAQLVELIDVLGDESVKHSPFLKWQQRSVAVVGVHVGPQASFSSQRPVRLTDLWVVDVVADRRSLLSLGVLRPESVRAAKVRQPRVR